MTKEDILHHFQDINFYYNDCMMYDDLSRMLDELIAENKGEPCDDCISRKAVLELATPVDSMYADITVEMISTADVRKLPSVQPVIPNMTITVDDSYMRNVRRDCGLYD